MKLGLALGGGGLRGAAHIGILHELLENDIVPDMIAGTSAGSIIASFFAAGFSPKKMTELISYLPFVGKKELERALEPPPPEPQVLSWLPLLPMGIINSKYLEMLLAKVLGKKKFDQLLLPLAVVGADLYNGETVIYCSQKQTFRFSGSGRTVVETQALVHQAVTASCAIPGIFTPVKVGHRTLVDGGLVNNVPADVLRAMGADVVLGVDLGFHVEHTTPFKHIFDVLLQTYDIMGQRITDFITGKYADLILKPATGSAALYDFHKIPGIIEAGRREARRKMPEIKKIIGKK